MDDSDPESTEMLTLTLSNPSSGITINPSNMRTVASITDNDAPVSTTPSLDIRFAPNPVGAGDSTTVTYTLTNPAASPTDYTNISFTHNLLNSGSGTPLVPGISISRVRFASNTVPNIPSVSGACSGVTNGGTVSYSRLRVPTFGPPRLTGGTLSVSGVGLNAGESCSFTLSIDSRATATGTYTNNTSAVTADEGAFSAAAAASLTIESGSVVTVELSEGATVDESIGTFNFEVVLTPAIADMAVTANYAFQGGADNPDDYTLAVGSSGVLTFAANETRKMITVTVVDDSIDELSEQIRLRLDNLSAGAVFAGGAAFLEPAVTITDNDDPVVSFVDDMVTVGERDGTLVFRLNLRTPPVDGSTATLDYAFAGSGAAGATYTDDYTFADGQSGKLTFTAADDIESLVVVTIVNDSIAEADEEFTLTLNNPVGLTLPGGAGSIVATGTIEDNDGPIEVSFVDDMVTVGEEDGTLTFRLNLRTPPDAGPTTLDYAFASSGTAGATYGGPNDYAFADGDNGTLNFAAGETEKTVVVTINNDSIDEANETFTLTLNNPTGLMFPGGAGSIVATGTITDNDGPEIVLPTITTVQEDDGIVDLPVSLSAASPQRVTVGYRLGDGFGGSAATSGADFRADNLTGVLTFEPMDTEEILQVEIIDDMDDERNENFVLEVSNVVNAMFDGGISSDFISITIEDNDDPAVFFARDNLGTVNENAGILAFEVNINGPPAEEALVSYRVSGIVSEQDYAGSGTGVLTFPALSTASRFFNLDITDDMIDEDDETLTVTLVSPTNLILGTPNAAVATIRDNDAPELTITGPVSVGEGMNAAFTITAQNNIAPKSDLTVRLNVEEPAGPGLGEFVSNEGMQVLTFAAGATSAIYTVEIDRDTTDEPDSSVTVTLLANDPATTGQEYTVAAAPGNTAMTTITDDDVTTVSVSDATANEGDGFLRFSVSLSGGLSQALTIPYTVSDGSAMHPGDYTTQTGQVMFAAGITEQTIPVTIVDDSVGEQNETVFLTLRQPSVTGVVFAGGGASVTATGTITDNETTTLSITGPDSVTEGAHAVFTVTANPMPAEDLTMSLRVNEESGDFLVSGQEGQRDLTFTAMASSATYTVEIENDTINEVDGSIAVTFEKTAGQNYTIPGGAQVIRVTLLDDDIPSLTIMRNSASVAESADAVYTITANPAPKTDEIDVLLNVADVAGSDFVAPDGNRRVTLTFGGGTSATYTLDIHDDNTDEANGMLTVALRQDPDSPRTYSVGSTASADITVTDDDTPDLTVSISGPISIIDEDTPRVVFAITASSTPRENLMVQVDLTQTGNFLAAGQTLSGTQTLSFTPIEGERARATYTVFIHDDNVDEDDGSVTLALSQTGSQEYTVAGMVSGGTQMATVTVRDNETPALTIAATPASINEDMNAVFTVTANPAPKEDLTVLLNVSQTGSFLASGQAGPRTQTLDFTGATATYTVGIDDDTLNEADGSVTVTLTRTGSQDYTVVGGTQTATTAVMDDDNNLLTITADATGSITEAAA